MDSAPEQHSPFQRSSVIFQPNSGDTHTHTRDWGKRSQLTGPQSVIKKDLLALKSQAVQLKNFKTLVEKISVSVGQGKCKHPIHASQGLITSFGLSHKKQSARYAAHSPRTGTAVNSWWMAEHWWLIPMQEPGNSWTVRCITFTVTRIFRKTTSAEPAFPMVH